MFGLAADERPLLDGIAGSAVRLLLHFLTRHLGGQLRKHCQQIKTCSRKAELTEKGWPA